ncbi:MAG: hypothetical protein QJR02_00400 [Sinobacteraceae bacterium]|nr:hypothetical protein [Nevskiaceae bacterium]
MELFQKMGQPETWLFQATPADYTCSETVATWFTIWAGGFAFLVLPWVFKRLLKDQDTIPLLMWIGGLVCSLLEPMLDHLGHLWWSHNLPGPAFAGYGLKIPYLIPPCYVFFIAMTGYWAYHKMKQGLDVAGAFKVWFMIAMTDVIMEIPGTSTHAYTYYGNAPFTVLGFPLAWGWMNGVSMFTVGYLLYLLAPRLRGWSKTFVLLVPISGMGAAYGITAWPYFLAINWPLPTWAAYLATLASLGITLLTVRLIGEALGGKPVAAGAVSTDLRHAAAR